MEWYEDLNRLGQCWVQNTPQNAAAWEDQKLVLWIAAESCAKEHFRRINHTEDREDLRRELMLKLVEETIEKYDPAMGALGAFVSNRAKHREQDMAASYTRRRNPEASLTIYEDEDEDGKDREIADRLPEENRYAEQVAGAFDVVAGELNYKAAEKRGKNTPELLPRKMWFTEQLHNLLRNIDGRTGDYLPYRRYEQDYFNAVESEYLGFYARGGEQCRRVTALALLQLKQERELLPGTASEKELQFNRKGWLPARVPQAFFAATGRQTVSDARISQTRDAFAECLKSELKESEEP